jgi:transcriptional regulator GlxA family with amidase domain
VAGEPITSVVAAPRRRRRVFFLIVPQVHVLDLSGPMQVFFEANGFGGDYEIRSCAVEATIRSAQGLTFSALEPLPEIEPGDTVLVPGLASSTLDNLSHVPAAWLRGVEAAGGSLGSICSGAFVLGRAGLLDGRQCTTHWKVADLLQTLHPRARVIRDRLYVRDGSLITSAGITSGIDMALSMVEENHGPVLVSKVAREMVVYLRRSGESSQESVFLDHRTHIHPGIHKVQDWLLGHVSGKPTIESLANVAGMSPRNLTRVFRQATGITLKDYSTRIKLEVAASLLRNPGFTLDQIAAECGFRDARQLRRLWIRRYGVNPSSWRSRDERRAIA